MISRVIGTRVLERVISTTANRAVNDTHDTWAHASVLVQYLNRLCAERTSR
jgi:hypothetical protein